jgi:hypothetical protein
MLKTIINSFEEYLDAIDANCKRGEKYNLYRGQSEDKPLLPTICRDKPTEDTTTIEKDMLSDLKRRGLMFINREDDEWDLLVKAQHFGMKTRLLDWTSNPMIALWFACKSEHHLSKDAYVYTFQAGEDAIIHPSKTTSPFNPSKTRILKPMLNSDRIIAQSGWFTLHKFSQTRNRFVTLESNLEYKGAVSKIVIPAEVKREVLTKLSRYGVNSRTVFPDLEGLCKHMNWKYLSDKH